MSRNSTKIFWTFIIICFLMSSYCCAQRFQFSLGGVYGSYAMNEVSSFQDEILIQLPVDAQVMSDFPNYIGYEGKFYYNFPRFSVGLYSSMHSTGSRISYVDYSGSVEYNQTARITQFGVASEYYLSEKRENPWQPFVSLQIGTGWTTFNIQNKIIVNDFTRSNQDIDFVTRNFTLQPSVGLKRFFGKYFSEAQAGYLVDSSKALSYAEKHDFKLINNKGFPIGTDWSGFRLSLAVGIRF
jgi:hypothetical protein